MTKHKIKTATAVYTGGGIYIYYGQLESGLYFRAVDDWDVIWICDSDTEAEEADHSEFYEAHTVEEITDGGEDFKTFWNAMLHHIIDKKPRHGKWSNYSPDELERRILKRAAHPTNEELQKRISNALERELERIYDEAWITSGDVTPEQFLKWERIVATAADLFAELIEQNK